MRKFCSYSLFLYCWLNSIACYAIDKYEVLPDLPAPLAQSAEASTVSNTMGDSLDLGSQSIGHEPSILSMIFSCILVVALIYIVAIVYTKLNQNGAKLFRNPLNDLGHTQANVISTTYLGNNKTLHVVELEGKRLLIGASSASIQLLKDLGTADEDSGEYSDDNSHIEISSISIPKIEIPKISFKKLRTKLHLDVNEQEHKNQNEENAEELQKEENSTDILGDLFEESAKEMVSDNKPREILHKVNPEEYTLHKKYL